MSQVNVNYTIIEDLMQKGEKVQATFSGASEEVVRKVLKQANPLAPQARHQLYNISYYDSERSEYTYIFADVKEVRADADLQR